MAAVMAMVRSSARTACPGLALHGAASGITRLASSAGLAGRTGAASATCLTRTARTACAPSARLNGDRHSDHRYGYGC